MKILVLLIKVLFGNFVYFDKMTYRLIIGRLTTHQVRLVDEEGAVLDGAVAGHPVLGVTVRAQTPRL